jgi:hypothetical protein
MFWALRWKHWSGQLFLGRKDLPLLSGKTFPSRGFSSTRSSLREGTRFALTPLLDFWFE